MRFRSWSLLLVIAVITESALKEEYRIYTYGFHNPCVDSGKFNFFFYVCVCLFHQKKPFSKPVSICKEIQKRNNSDLILKLWVWNFVVKSLK